MKRLLLLLFLINFPFVLVKGQSMQPQQTNLEQFLSNTKWTVNKLMEIGSIGDTLVFKKVKKDGQFFFKSQGLLQGRTWYVTCGNKSFWDIFKHKLPEWENTGSWKVNTTNNMTILNMGFGDRLINLKLLKQTKDSLIFITQ